MPLSEIQRKERERMTREEAIKILSTRDAHGVLCGYTSGVTEALDMAIEALQAQPITQRRMYQLGYRQAQKDRLKGEWIDCDWSIKCSECGYSMPWAVRNFCPNCGADMRGGEDK